MWFDERTQLINFKAIQEPPISVNVIDSESHIVADSLKVSEKPDKRISDVLVYFGRKDPTQSVTEVNNYAQAYLRTDLEKASDDEYGSSKIETIYSRWLNNSNKTGAIELASRKGRRFSLTPRQLSLKLTSKDSLIWLGQNIGVNHPVLQDVTGANATPIFQVQSVKEAGDNYVYELLEYTWTGGLPDDPEPGVETMRLGSKENNINLRDKYDSLFASSPNSSTVFKVIIEPQAWIGSDTNSLYSLDTGSWPAGAEVRLLVQGLGVGKGGDSEYLGTQIDGGPAIILNHDLVIEGVTGFIGGGGGAGGTVVFAAQQIFTEIKGGGGAGQNAGTGHENGTQVAGGNGVYLDSNEQSGDGGDLGQPGAIGNIDSGPESPPGTAGIAINKNGHTLTIQSGAGNILGSITA